MALIFIEFARKAAGSSTRTNDPHARHRLFDERSRDAVGSPTLYALLGYIRADA